MWYFLIGAPWAVFVAYWAISALKTRTTEKKESSLSRYGILLIEVCGFTLLFSGWASIGPLGHLVLRRTYAMAFTGVALTWLGIAITLWARHHLGQYWSARITIKVDHELIRTGPYTHLRHPIYTGLILASMGSAMAIDQWRCLLGLLLITTGYWIKARKEETMLQAQFGEAFQEHCQHTGFLLPKFR
jgi:protein-S-isoprenylcysteine O-methyltransferase Ste14